MAGTGSSRKCGRGGHVMAGSAGTGLATTKHASARAGACHGGHPAPHERDIPPDTAGTSAVAKCLAKMFNRLHSLRRADVHGQCGLRAHDLGILVELFYAACHCTPLSGAVGVKERLLRSADVWPQRSPKVDGAAGRPSTQKSPIGSSNTGPHSIKQHWLRPRTCTCRINTSRIESKRKK